MPIAFDLPCQAAHSSHTEDTEYLGTQKQAIIKKFNLEVLDGYTLFMILLICAYDTYQSQHDLVFWIPIYTMKDV